MEKFISVVSGDELDEAEFIQKWLLKVKVIHDSE